MIMANYKKQVFEMLGIQPDEEFRLYDTIENTLLDGTFKLDESVYVRHKSEGKWEYYYVQLVNILNEAYKIEKIRKPTEDDIIVLRYGKLCGYKWVGKNQSGDIYCHKVKPKKIGYYWDSSNLSYRVGCDISFLSWEDEEPTNIEEVLREYEND